MRLLRIAMLAAAVLGPAMSEALAEDGTPVPPVYVGPDNDDQAGPDHPAIECQGVDCLPPEVNTVEECEGANCTPAPKEESGPQIEKVQ